MIADAGTICHVIAQLRLGAGRALVELARAQRRMGHTVVVAVASDVDDQWRSERDLIAALESDGVVVITLGDWFRRDRDRILEAAAQLRERVRDSPRVVVHAHLAPAISVGQLAGASVLVATCHGWNPNRPAAYDAQDAAAYRLCDVVTSPSRFWADRLNREACVPRVEIVPYGLDLSGEPREEPIRAANAAPRVVTVCELTHRKGVDLLLDAMALLWRDVPAATLNIFGRGDAEHELRAHAARIDPGGHRIQFEGWVPNPRSRLGSFTLFCLASRSDNYPLAIIDAMLSGLPVVATSVGGIAEAVEDSGCGRVVPPEAPGALAAAMRAALGDPLAAAAVGRRGWRYARARFDVDEVARTFARLYRGS
jgi:glycosyltransferase involved in cell wall biosynthesis